MKRFVFRCLLVLMCCSIFSTAAFAEGNGRVPTSGCAGSHEALYGAYPMVGGDEASIYYLDPSSCTYSIEGNKAYVSCLLYATGGGAAPDGGPGKLIQHVITFETYKNQHGKRIIHLESEMVNDQDISARAARYDEGFLVELFWLIAKQSGLSDSLD